MRLLAEPLYVSVLSVGIMAAPTPQQLAEQAVSLGQQLAQMKTLIDQQQMTITMLKQHDKHAMWNGLLDKKFMLPENFLKTEDWRENGQRHAWITWRSYNRQLHLSWSARAYPNIIEPTYPTESGRKLARDLYKSMKKLTREPDGKQLVRSFKSTHNIYELWRLLWLTFQPAIGATEMATTRL